MGCDRESLSLYYKSIKKYYRDPKFTLEIKEHAERSYHRRYVFKCSLSSFSLILLKINK